MIDTRTFRKFLMLLLVGLAMAAAFLPKKTRYEGLNVLSEIRIPSEMPGWTSVDISDQIDVNQDVYNFISDVFARIYQNPYGEQVLLLVLDAGNFHNPKVCYTSSGYSVKEKESVTLSVDQTKIKANMLDIHRPDRAIFLFYWMCIDRKIRSWTGQKVTELAASLFHQKKAGLMVRMEISSKARTPQQAVALAQEFIQTMSHHMNEEDRPYVFGSP